MTSPFTFNEPTTGGGDFEPAPIGQDCVGYVVVIRPKSIDDSATFKQPDGTFIPRPAAVLDLLVLDASSVSPEFKGAPLYYNAATQKSLPPTDAITLPAYFEDVRWSGVNIVRTLRDELTAHPINPLLLGFIHHGQGTKGNPPVNIGKISVNQWGAPRDPAVVQGVNRLAEQYWSQVLAGTFQNPTSTLIQPPPHGNPEAIKRWEQRVKSRETQQARAGAAPSPAVAQQPHGGPAVVIPAPPTSVTAPATPGYVYTGTPSAHPYAEPQPAAPAVYVPAGPEHPIVQAAAQQDLPLPPNVDATTWQTLPEAAKQAVWASLGGVPQVQPTH